MFILKLTDRWGRAFLTRDFFHNMGEKMGDKVMLIVAEEDEKLVAGALNLIGGDTLFGRLWGCLPYAYFPNLHFEACYYQVKCQYLYYWYAISVNYWVCSAMSIWLYPAKTWRVIFTVEQANIINDCCNIGRRYLYVVYVYQYQSNYKCTNSLLISSLYMNNSWRNDFFFNVSRKPRVSETEIFAGIYSKMRFSGVLQETFMVMTPKFCYICKYM